MTLTQSIRNLTLTAMALATLITVATPAAAQMNSNSPERIEFVLDVAEDMDLFVEPRIPVGTEPLRGSFFVTEGKIFPYGTIPANGSEFNPKTVAGAIGTWFCKGTFLVKGSVFDKTAAAVLSDQMYLFKDGTQSIATTGTEGGVGVAVRPVIGGTGYYAGYTGEQTQEFLGFNKTGGVNLRVTVKLRKVTNFR
jgi:hypothetical protein